MKILTAGGDMRMIHACKSFGNSGFDCSCFALDPEICKDFGIAFTDRTADADVIILPPKSGIEGFLSAPFAKEKFFLQDIFDSAPKKTLFLVGGISPNGVDYIDYAKREDFQFQNAVPTAEAAIKIAIEELDITLSDANAVVVGFGRIGSYLAGLLKSFGANVTTVSRSLKSRAQSKITGFNAVGFENFEAPLSRADIVFNTVPSSVFGESQIKAIKKGTALIDLASFPFGVDRSLAEKLGLKVITALGLPGKSAPKSAGEIIFKTALSIFQDRGLI